VGSRRRRWSPHRRWLVPGLVLLGILVFGPGPVLAAGRVLAFSFRDRELTGHPGSEAARLYLPEGLDPASGPVDLLVVLHGLNGTGRPAPLFDPQGVDLAAASDALIASGEVLPRFVIAAPGQTRRAAKTKTLWRHFDLAAFVKAVRRQLPPGVRLTSRPTVIGHSGAGCEDEGGLWWIAAHHGGTLRALVVLDSCVNAGFGDLLYAALWPGRGLPGFCLPDPASGAHAAFAADGLGPPEPWPASSELAGDGWGPPEAPWEAPAVCAPLTEPRRRGRTWLLNVWQREWKRPMAEFEERLGLELWQAEGPRGLYDLKRSDRRWLSARVEATHREAAALGFAEALRRLFASPALGRQLDEEYAQAKQEYQQRRGARGASSRRPPRAP